ncbi:MAG: isoprenylcysteine carboxylmethyltransferase family protein [Acidobacteriota bacterium]|nr:isoprenylcysteine carboxylmethyltransferase family protein [Acidobacteriota bacterium]
MRHVLVRIIGGAWLGVGLVWLVSSLNTKRVVQVQPIASRLGHVLLVVVAFVLLFADEIQLGPLDRQVIPYTLPWTATGAVQALAGIIFAIVARFALGRNWSSAVTVKQDHQLVQSGPYRIVRHPIYSGFLLAFLGSAIAFGELRDFAALLLALIGWKIKSLTEEKFMLAQFGEQYVAYRRHVKGLIPLIW